MEIVSLSAAELPLSGGATITKMTAGVKYPERVNIFLDGQFAFSLDLAQVVDYKLKIGQTIEAARRAELERAAEFNRYYQLALQKALGRPHSEAEMRRYLNKKTRTSYKMIRRPSGEYHKKTLPGMHPDLVELILDRLKAKNYLSDARFVEFLAGSRKVAKGVSRRRLEQELRQKGVDPAAAAELLAAHDEAAALEQLLTSKAAKYAGQPEKLFRYLVAQGFNYSDIKAALGSLS